MHPGLVRDPSEESRPCTQVSHCSNSTGSTPYNNQAPASNVIDVSSVQYHPDNSMVQLVHSLNDKIEQLQSEMLAMSMEQKDKPRVRRTGRREPVVNTMTVRLFLFIFQSGTS